MPSKKTLFLIISSLYISYIFIPLIYGLTGITIRSISIIATVLLVILYPKALINKTLLWFCIYIFVLLFYLLIGKVLSISGIMYMTETNKLITEVAMILPTLLIFSILTYLNDYKLLKNIALISLISTLITFTYLIPLIVENNNILRVSLESNFRSMYIGIPTYPALHSYVIVLPALLFLFKYPKGWMKYIFLVISILYLYIIFISSITTNILIALIVIIFFLLYKNNIKRTTTIVGIFILFVLFLHEVNLLIYVFDFGVSATEGTYSAGKFEGFRDMYLTGKTSSSVATRNELRSISLNSFFESPLWGGNIKQIDLTHEAFDVIASSDAVIGGHSTLIDRLGGMGLLGFIPFIMIIISGIKTWKKFFCSKNAWYFYCAGLFAAAILLYEKGLFGQEGWFSMLVYLPAMILFGNNYVNKRTREDSKKW